MTKPFDLDSLSKDTILWGPSGAMRVVAVPAEIGPVELPRIILVGRYWLSKREFQVGCMLSCGVTRKEMVDRLGLSEDVVASELVDLYGKLGVRNEKQACSILGRYGVNGLKD